MRNFAMLLLLLLVLHFLSSSPLCFATRLFPTSLLFTRSHQMHHFHSPAMSIAAAPSPSQQALSPTSSRSPSPRHHNHHHHRRWHLKPKETASSPSGHDDCGQTCVEPLTSTPYGHGSPCGCVFPMKVQLLLSSAPFSIFPVTNELEIEVAAGTYLEQSQVKIMGASADSENQGKTVVDINLVPLGEKFDNTTAILIYERFRHKKLTLNESLFGDYEVTYISYPGLPSSIPYGGLQGIPPTASAGGLPITANFVSEKSGIGFRTIAIICLSGFVLVLVLVGAISIVVKWKKYGKSSNAVGPAFASSMNKRSGHGSMLSSSIRSPGSGSFMSTMAACALSVKTFTLSELENATYNFSSKRILGEGGFGRVYHGTMEDGAEVAVKLLTRDNQNRDREFIAEVEMLSRLHHRNLVKLIGICIEGRTRCLVYELVHNGSVESHLHGDDKEKGPLDWDARLKIALGAARGLAYLHEDSNPRVIHRDFKASNVLLQEDFTPKVSDFGLAREATEGSRHISTRVMGTFGYVAPEYAMTGHLLVKSDVYSYGVVLLELLTGRKPVDMSQPPGQENLVTWARPLLTNREGLEQLIDPSLSGTYDFDDMAKVAAIASMCVHQEVSQRPFMGEVVQALKLIYNDADETIGDCHSQKESSVPDSSDFKGGDLAPSDSSWWNATPRLTYGQASTFVTMEYYSSGPLSESSMAGAREGGLSLPNRSGPLRPVRSRRNLFRSRGSMSEHGGTESRRFWF
ncbi:PREDICTED: receptor-like serine/threonine-protein kinase ALE2 [Tarenaya hassleriana]|uniref:receptor-like serine/threonine-protein kinase ALE2 n=1 Tax=Tarenaya hassleriana TaxID=28532 RepID=UPI00053C94FA|nr:PREDICTED: receptor-like serine/threonine-protein kinase ALE2 [Tarenaya hassleriana]